jgi:hypothetical protein
MDHGGVREGGLTIPPLWPPLELHCWKDQEEKEVL